MSDASTPVAASEADEPLEKQASDLIDQIKAEIVKVQEKMAKDSDEVTTDAPTSETKTEISTVDLAADETETTVSTDEETLSSWMRFRRIFYSAEAWVEFQLRIQQKEELEAKIKEIEEQLAVDTKLREEFEKANALYSQENAVLKQNQQELDANARRVYAGLQEDEENLKKQHEELEAQKAQLDAEIASHDELQREQRRIYDEWKQIIDATREDNNNLKEQLRQLQAQNEEMHQQILEHREWWARYDETRNHMLTLEEKNVQREDMINALHDQLRACETERAAHGGQHATFEALFKQQQTEIEQRNAQNAELQRQNVVMQRTIEELQKKNARLQPDKDEDGVEYADPDDELRVPYADLAATQQKYEDQIQSLQAQCAEKLNLAQTVNDDLRLQIKELSAQNDQLHADCAQQLLWAQGNTDELSHQNKNLRSEIAELQSKLLESQQSNKHSQKELENVQRDIRSLQSEHEALHKNYQELYDLQAARNERFEQLSAEYEREKQEMQVRYDALQSELAKINEETISLKFELRQKNDELQAQVEATEQAQALESPAHDPDSMYNLLQREVQQLRTMLNEMQQEDEDVQDSPAADLQAGAASTQAPTRQGFKPSSETVSRISARQQGMDLMMGRDKGPRRKRHEAGP